jgi:enterochelin esterase-like enzyme
MKKAIVLLLAMTLIKNVCGQNISGTVVTKVVHSTYLQNSGGENPNRRISVYLPPNYDKSKQCYPVIYYLHDFMGTDSIPPNIKTFLTG